MGNGVAATLPTNDDAEREVLGAILMHPTTLAEVGDVVKAEDFGHPTHRAIFEAIHALDQAHKPLDPKTVAAEMKSQDTYVRLNAVGGDDYFLDLQTSVVSIENIRYHARAVRAKAHRRRCAVALTELRAAAFATMGDDEFSVLLERRIVELVDSQREEGGLRRIKPVMKQVLTELQERYERRRQGENVDLLGATTGYDRLNYLLGGWQAGKLYIIAARPGMGKTSFAMSTAAHAAAAGAHIAVFSREMLDTELVTRMLSSDARIDSKKIERAALDVRDWSSITRAAGAVGDLPIHIDSSPGLTFGQILSRSRRLRRKLPADAKFIIVIDYLQLLDNEGAKDEKSREREIAKMSRGAKDMAKELNCAVLALSQLNRGVEGRTDQRPKLSDLRESGAIEQDADVVAFVYREEVALKEKCPEEEKGVAEVIIGKQRGGPLGTVRLAFLDTFTRFENLAPGREEREPPAHWGDR